MGMRDEFPIADLQLRPNAAKFIGTLYDEIDRLRAELDEAQLRSIEARNPGIDMDEVRRVRER